VANQWRPQPLDEVAQGVGRFRAVGGHDPPVRAGDRQRQRLATARSRIVGQQRHADRGLLGQPRLELVDTIRAADLDATRVEDRLGEGGRKVFGRLERAALGCPRPVGARGHGVEVEAELELTAGRTRRGSGTGRTPAVGAPTGHACRGHVAALGHRPQPVGALLGRLAGHRRQALDQRPELVLAEQPDDGVAVVVASRAARGRTRSAGRGRCATARGP
jgi:hypothetical protein